MSNYLDICISKCIHLSFRYTSELDSINREQKSDQDRLDNESRKKLDIESKLKSKGHELEEAQKRKAKLEDHIRASEAALDEQKRTIQVSWSFLCLLLKLIPKLRSIF
jgi:peptidoglycan hydrolase CwlO-like protein